MRVALCLIIFAAPAAAWEFTPTPVCTLSHETAEASLSVTYDPRLATPYAISISQLKTWPGDPVFSIRFDGPLGLTISTDRQSLSESGRTLTVTDSGFGNVLNGLEFNITATALLGETAISFPLHGAAPVVQAFRACTTVPTA